jgi:hypothetical protein
MTTRNGGGGRGILYLSIGKAHCAYVARGVRHLRHFGFRGPIRVVTDQCDHRLPLHEVEVVRVPAVEDGFPSRVYKTRIYEHAFEGATLYLDADTMCIAPVDPVWEELEHHDLCMCRDLHPDVGHVIRYSANDPERRRPEYDLMLSLGLERRTFYNSGVMLFRRAPGVEALFRSWHREWLRFGHEDQLALVRAMAKSDVAVRLLPDRWNLRPRGIASVAEAQRNGGRILHFLSRQRPLWDQFQDLVQ